MRSLPRHRDFAVEGVILGAVVTDPSAARKRFFLKKEAKTFAYWCARCGSLHAMRTKVFWFFFSKKNCLLSSSSRGSAMGQP
jgi:uncharacterized OB-fold protein